MQICVHWPDYTCRSAPLFSPASAGAGRAIDLGQFIGLIDVSCIRSAYPGAEWPRCPFLSTSWYVGTPIRRTRLRETLSCRKICKWGPLSDTCRLIFADRTAGAAGRCPASRPGPSEMPRDPNKGFCRTPAIRRAGHQDVAFLRMCRTRTLSRSPSRYFSRSLPLDTWMRLSGSSPLLGLPSAFRVFALPLVSRSICPPGRIVAPEGPRIPAGCVCYPASCLRTRVVKKILATGGWLEEGIMREWACAAFVDIFFGWLITSLIW